jgi:hypothetical protein
MNLHPNARTTPKIRAEIKASGLTRSQVMEKYNVGYGTATKWLERDDVGNLRLLTPTESQEIDKPAKAFKDYPPGFIHIDIKYLPQMPDEQRRR